MRRLVAILLLLSTIAVAQDHRDSKKFRVQIKQSLKGILTDSQPARISGLKLQLRRGKQIVIEITTNDEGAYDFGEIEPGEYRIRIVNQLYWCAPRVKCVPGGLCQVETVVRVCTPIVGMD